MKLHCTLPLLGALSIRAFFVAAAPAAERTPAPTPFNPSIARYQSNLEKRKDDVIVNIGAVKTETTVVTTAIPTTVLVAFTTEGKVVTSTIVSTEVTKVQMVVTQTAVETRIVKETVKEGVTVPITLTTTGYELDIETQVVQIQSTVLCRRKDQRCFVHVMLRAFRFYT